MIAEVISIGDELTSGQRLDTNSQWLSGQLGDLGVRVVRHATIADDLQLNIDAFRDAALRADVVVSTGGLGPTADDLTREALAAAMGVELELHGPSLVHIRNIFESRGRRMPENNRVQALFPAGSQVIPNPHGTAPGIAARLRRGDGKECRLFALPGVPAELHEMWRDTVAGEIQKFTGNRRVIQHRRIKCFGAGESHIEGLLPDLIRRGRTPSVGITASEATITLRITAIAESVAACQCLIEPTERTIRDCLGALVYGEEDDELQHIVIRLLTEQDKTIATVEAGTEGLLAGWLRMAGGPRFLGGFVVDGDADAGRLLGMSAEVHTNPHPDSETALAWATACRVRSGSDVALAVGAFPDSARQADAPVQVHIALATTDDVQVWPISLAGHPAILKPRVAKEALNRLRLALSGM